MADHRLHGDIERTGAVRQRRRPVRLTHIVGMHGLEDQAAVLAGPQARMTLLAVSDELDDALQRADQALYRAKRGGRNRCDAAWEEQGA